MPTRIRPVVLGLLLAVATLVPAAGPAAAHDEIESTSPTAGSMVTSVPGAVVLTFGEDVISAGTKVTVTAASGAVVSAGEATIAGGTVTQPLLPLTESGLYTVAYRIVSADGHPVSDSFTFTLANSGSASAAAGDGSATASPATPATPAASGAAPPSGSAGDGSSVASVAASPAAATGSPTSDSGGSVVVWLAVAVAAVAAVGLAVWALARRGPRGVDADEPRDAGTRQG